MFARFNVGVRLGLGFAVVLSLLIVVAVIGINRLSVMHDELDAIAGRDLVILDSVDTVFNVKHFLYDRAHRAVEF